MTKVQERNKEIYDDYCTLTTDEMCDHDAAVSMIQQNYPDLAKSTLSTIIARQRNGYKQPSAKSTSGMVIQKSAIKKILHGYNLRVSENAIELIDSMIRRQIDKIGSTANEGNIKSLNENASDIISLAFSKPVTSKTKHDCSRCGMIKDSFIKNAKNLQQFVSEEAKIMIKHCK